MCLGIIMPDLHFRFSDQLLAAGTGIVCKMAARRICSTLLMLLLFFHVARGIEDDAGLKRWSMDI